MTGRAQNADFRRKPQIFADSPLLLEIQAFGGGRQPQKTADFRRKPKIFTQNRRKLQIGLRHLRSVTFSSALYIEGARTGFWANRVFACVTSAIFVFFVVFRGLRSKPSICGHYVHSSFSIFVLFKTLCSQRTQPY